MFETEETTEEIAEDSESEEEAAQMLDAEQRANLAQQQLLEAAKTGQNYKHPSYLKYTFLILIALVIDIVDAADITVIGILLSKIISIIGTAIIYFTLWLTNNRVKRAGEYEENLATAVFYVQQRVSYYSRLAMKTSKITRRIPGMRNLAHKIPRTMVKIRRVARKNPLTKVLIGGAINLVPFLAILNLMIVWVALSYMDEKGVFKQARKTSKEVIDQLETA